MVGLQLLTWVMLPDAQMWLSFSITIPLRSCLCIDTPPTSMAYFSTRRKPGVVLRVPATSPCQPPADAIARSWEHRVAMPEARARQFRAGLSPRRRHLAGPLTTAVSVTPSGPLGAKEHIPRSLLEGIYHFQELEREILFFTGSRQQTWAGEGTDNGCEHAGVRTRAIGHQLEQTGCVPVALNQRWQMVMSIKEIIHWFISRFLWFPEGLRKPQDTFT